MSPPARFAVAAARLALADAGLAELDREAHLDTGIVVGTAFGPSSVTEQLLAQIFGAGPEAASPALFTESVASASAAQMALVLGARGPSVALTQREASDLAALAEGVRLVSSGAARRALVTVVDEMIPLLHAALDRFRALARPEADGFERARPFDRRRSGVIAAEGAVVLVLERATAAAERGARPRATVAATVRGFDPSAPAWDWGTGGDALAGTLRRGLERHGVAPSSIGLIASGASGSRRGDALEAACLRALFGSRRPPVAAFKARTGEYGGAALAAAVLAAGGAALAPTAGFTEPDPALGEPAFAPLTAPLPAEPRRVLASSLSTAGGAAWAVLDGGGRAANPAPPPAV
jgi:3-oxoacyl-(acyl-carrier-protein) synthase